MVSGWETDCHHRNRIFWHSYDLIPRACGPRDVHQNCANISCVALQAHATINTCTLKSVSLETAGLEVAHGDLMSRVKTLQNQFDKLSETCYESRELCEEATAAIQVQYTYGNMQWGRPEN